MPNAAIDAVILGGGLSGLTLALQLKSEYPDFGVLVLERKRHPLPDAAHKVGESTVEIGAHYSDTTFGAPMKSRFCAVRQPRLGEARQTARP